MAKAQGNNGGAVKAIGAAIVAFIGIKYLMPLISRPLQMAQYAGRLRVEVIGVKLGKKGITFTVDIANPNRDNLTIDSLIGKVFVNYRTAKQIDLGTVTQYGPIIVQGNHSTRIPIAVRLNAVSSVLYFLQTLTNATNQVLTFTGTLALSLAKQPPQYIHLVEQAKVA